MSKIITIAAILLSSGAAMAQGSDFASMVVDYGYAPGLNGSTVTLAAKPVAPKAVVAQASDSKARAEVVVAQAGISNADAELGFFVPTARKQAAPAAAATMLASKSAQRVQ